MKTTSFWRGALVIATMLSIGTLPLGAQARARPGSPLQDSTLNNLEHAPGYATAPLGTLGQVVRLGSGSIDVVMIPGWGFGAGVFERFMRENASRFRMVAITLPGFEGTLAPPMPPAGTSYGEATWIRAAEQAVVHLIERERLRKPIVVGHFIVGSQIALRLALDHPDLIGGLILVGAEPMRVMASRRDSSGKTPMSREERVTGADSNLAKRWFKTVTKETFDHNNFTPAHYSRDSVRGATLWKESARVPMPVMIRYLVEYGAMDLSDEFARIAVPTRVLAPSFESRMLADPQQSRLRSLYLDSWLSIGAKNPLISVVQVPDAHIFISDDNPAAVRNAIAAVASSRR